MTQQQPLRMAAYLFIPIAIIIILVYAKPFLVPVCFAGLFSMLLLPEVRWMRRKGIGNVPAILLSMLTLVGSVALILFLLGWQVQNLAEKATDIEQQLAHKVSSVQEFISNELNIPKEEQAAMIKKQQSSSSGKLSGLVTGFLSGVGSMLTNTLLVLVYIFLFLFLRDRLKTFVLKLVAPQKRPTASVVLTRVQQVSNKYLTSMGAMIVILWIMYGIGFSIIGVKQPIFFALLCGTLELVPFVGNITGTLLTMIFTLAQGGDMQLILLIAIVYALVQFIQTYFLEPMLVGEGVKINPLTTIAGIVAGELIWGIPGMILAIPVLGAAKIICEHIEPLQPYAYLLGSDESKKRRSKQSKNNG